jgi:hypothetical protein
MPNGRPFETTISGDLARRLGDGPHLREALEEVEALDVRVAGELARWRDEVAAAVVVPL